MTDPKLDRLYDRIQRATAHADDPRDTQLWRDVAARLRDDEAAVAAANQRADALADAARDVVAEWGTDDWIRPTFESAIEALRALVADQPTTGESDQPSPFKVERSDHTHSNEGAFFVDDGIGVEFFPTQEAADAYVARLRALAADQPATLDPGWPDETRRQPDQEHT